MKKKDLTIIAGTSGTLDYGQGPLLVNGQVKQISSSFIGGNEAAEKMYLKGQYICDLTP